MRKRKQILHKFYLKLIGLLTKKGLKNNAKKIVSSVFLKINLYYKGRFLIKSLKRLFKVLNIYVEAKSVKIRRSRYIVPFSLNLKRKIYLITKWLILSVKKKKKRKSISLMLLQEIRFVLRKAYKDSLSLEFKKLNTTTALANRSNIHYRW